MTIGERIKWMRTVRGWSQYELAVKMGYQDRSAISLVETNKRGIDAELIVKYAEVLGVTPTYLLGWEDDNLDENERELLYYVSSNEHTKKLLMSYAEKLKEVMQQ